MFGRREKVAFKVNPGRSRAARDKVTNERSINVKKQFAIRSEKM
jgi:hypothetical protein